MSGQAVAPVDFSAPPRRRALVRPWCGRQTILPNRSSRWRWCWLMVRCRREQGSVQPGGRRLWPVRRHRR